MDALLMCGGAGSRFDADVEKPLYPIAGEPMVDRVRRALAASSIGTTYAVVSPNAPETRGHFDRTAVPTIATPGAGYVADLGAALDDPRVEPPILTAAADLPLLSAAIVDEVYEAYRERTTTGGRDVATAGGYPSMTVCVPRGVKRDLGVTVEESPVGGDDLVPTGLNALGTATGSDDVGAESSADDATDELVHVVRAAGAAINVNRLEDARIAEEHATR